MEKIVLLFFAFLVLALVAFSFIIALRDKEKGDIPVTWSDTTIAGSIFAIGIIIAIILLILGVV